jgi:hypothetical protein
MRLSLSRPQCARSWFYLLTYILNCITSIVTLDISTSRYFSGKHKTANMAAENIWIIRHKNKSKPKMDCQGCPRASNTACWHWILSGRESNYKALWLSFWSTVALDWRIRNCLCHSVYLNCLEKLEHEFFTPEQKKPQKHMSVSDWFLSLTERLHSIINNLTLQFIAYDRHNTFTVRASCLPTAQSLWFIESQFTTPQSVLHWINTNTETLHCGFWHPFKCPAVVANGLTGINNELVKPIFIFNWSCIYQ